MGSIGMAAPLRARLRQGMLAAIAGLCLAVLLAPAARAADAPDLTLSKTSSASGAVSVGDRFTYTLTVANVGSGTAHGITIGDNLPIGVVPVTPLPPFDGGNCSFAGSQGPSGPPNYSVFCERASMPAGASATVTVTVRLTGHVDCGDLTNTAAIEANDEPSGATANNTGSVTDTVTCPPSISITAQAPSYAHVGDTIELSMGVTNRGSVELHDVRVRDAACSGAVTLVADGDGDATLAPAETWRYRCAHRVTPAAGQHVSGTAIVTASSADGPARASDRATVRVLRPGLTLRVTPDPVSGSPGEAITYRFVLRNTGDATLTGLSVDDDQLGHIGDVAKLAPGHAATFRVQRVVSARDVWVVDEATATGADPSGRRVRATDRAAVTLVAPTATGPAARSGGGGTAFTGAPIAVPLTATVVLALLGASALLIARRQRA